MNMRFIQSRLLFRKINNKQTQSRLFSMGFDKHLIIFWRNWYTTAFVGSEVNLSFGNFQLWCKALKLLFNPFLVCLAAVLSGSTMISIEGTLSINLLKPNKAAVHQQLLKRLYSQKNNCNDCNDFSDYNDIIAPLDKLIMSFIKHITTLSSGVQ